jgi:hypothetical protein
LGIGAKYLLYLNHLKITDYIETTETRKSGGFVNRTMQEMCEE